MAANRISAITIQSAVIFHCMKTITNPVTSSTP